MKSGGYECCSMCYVVGTSIQSTKEQLKRKTQRVCYLPNETIMERNRETFEEDAKYANTLGITVFN